MALMKFREPNQVKWQGVRPGHNGTQVLADGQCDNSTIILYTVPAGKVFYWCGWNMIAYGPAAAGDSYLYIYTAVPAIWRRIQRFFYAITDSRALSKSYWPPLEIPEGYSIRLVSTVVGHALQGSIHGWVE